MNNKNQAYKNKRIFKLYLAFESYADDTGDNDNVLINEIDKETNRLWKGREAKKISKEEDLLICDDILTKYEKLLDIVGRNNFIFYDDGDVEYIWKWH